MEVTMTDRGKEDLNHVLQRKYDSVKNDIDHIDKAINGLQLDYSKKLEILQSKKRNNEETRQHIIALLKLEGHSVENEELINSNSTSDASITDNAFNLLSKIHIPLHYKDISEKLRGQGIYISGVNPAATLLSRISRDERFKRVKRGTYGLKGWRINTSKKKRSKNVRSRKE